MTTAGHGCAYNKIDTRDVAIFLMML